MKVRVVLSVDVDPDAWRAEYGDETLTAADIREAVRSSIAEAAATPGIVAPNDDEGRIILDVRYEQ